MAVAKSQAIPASDRGRLNRRFFSNVLMELPRHSRGGSFVLSQRLCVLGAASLMGLASCDRSPSDVREWGPNDHDQPASAPGQVTARAAGEGPDPTLVDLAWQRNCATCHGALGRGDGPQGPMIRAPDLTRADWQERISDDEMATIIRKGKNKMPAFDLPDQVVQGLVQRIRATRGK
jgi:mono/diheme cytochrome c family protein